MGVLLALLVMIRAKWQQAADAKNLSPTEWATQILNQAIENTQ